MIQKNWQGKLKCSFKVQYFFLNRALYEIVWKNMIQATDDDIIRRMRVAYWIPETSDTHSEYVRVIIIAFLQQHWLHDGASVLRYTYIASLVNDWARTGGFLDLRSHAFLVPCKKFAQHGFVQRAVISHSL